MKSFIYVIISLFLTTSVLISQGKDSLIQLYPGLADTIDQFDREYFELFQNIDGFESAVFFIRDNEKLVSKVTYTENGKQKDTTFIQQLSALENARERIKKLEVENEYKYESPKEYSIKTKNGKEYHGEIVMFSKSKFYVRTEENFSIGVVNTSNFKLDFSNVETLTLVGETNTWSCMGYGALAGLGIGLIAAVASSTGEGGGGFGTGVGYIIGIPLVTVLSGIAGLIVGLVSSSSDEVLTMDYQTDLLQLKDNAKYYFKDDESIENNYVELE